MQDILVQTDDPLGLIIQFWLITLESEATRTSYARTMHRFRAALLAHGMDLDTDERIGLERQRREVSGELDIADRFEAQASPLATFIEMWVQTTYRAGKDHLAPASRKQRLAVISSFYAYAGRHRHLLINPTNQITWPSVTEYEQAQPISDKVLTRRLRAIDLDTDLGARDFALLAVAFATGRRARELEYLDLGDITEAEDHVEVRWTHGKGGRTHDNVLDPGISHGLLAHVVRHYGMDWRAMPPNTPVWTSLSPHRYDERLSYWGIRAVYDHRLGISRVHASRHSFSEYYLEAGGDVLGLMGQLGHKSLAVTHRYVQQLPAGRRDLSRQIAAKIGFVDLPVQTNQDE